MEGLNEISQIINIIKNHKIKYPFYVKGLNRFTYKIYNISITKKNVIIISDIYNDYIFLHNLSKFFQKNLLKELENNIINEHIWND